MSDETEPRRVYIGTFSEGMPINLVIPRDALKPAERILDRERERREKEIALAKAQALGAARARGKLTRALNMILRRGRRP